jgi:hypothetical protein
MYTQINIVWAHLSAEKPENRRNFAYIMKNYTIFHQHDTAITH